MTTTAPVPTRDRAHGRIGTAPDEDVRPTRGGRDRPAAPPAGLRTRPEARAAEARTSTEQEEVFGPVRAAVPHDGGDDAALAIAGGTRHGPPGTARAEDRERAAAFATAGPRPF
jgi:acyl-CoA reductase-like NAD-dependent aldehyde dehydrogenase